MSYAWYMCILKIEQKNHNYSEFTYGISIYAVIDCWCYWMRLLHINDFNLAFLKHFSVSLNLLQSRQIILWDTPKKERNRLLLWCTRWLNKCPLFVVIHETLLKIFLQKEFGKTRTAQYGIPSRLLFFLYYEK